MSTFLVHLRSKTMGEVKVEAETTMEAMQKVRRMILKKDLPKGAMEETGHIVITHAEEV